MDRAILRPRFAFVEMASAEQAEPVIGPLDGTLRHERGHPI
jgi:hypothetical protein